MSLENWYQVKGAANERWHLRAQALGDVTCVVNRYTLEPERWTYTLWWGLDGGVGSGGSFATRDEAMTHVEAIVALENYHGR